MTVYHADAIVIRSREFGESDRLVTLFSREMGKIQAVAKGVRKPKSRQRAGVQLFTYADYLVHRGRNLDTINQASPKESFPHLLTDLGRTLAATGMAELLAAATIAGQPQPELFTLTLSCFYLLEHFEPSLLLAGYAMRLVDILGYAPVLDHCTVCASQLKEEVCLFSPEAGGVLCARCRAGYAGKYLKAGSLAVMRRLLYGDLTKLDRLRCPEWMMREIQGALQWFCEHKFDQKLKSWSMGAQLSSGDTKG